MVKDSGLIELLKKKPYIGMKKLTEQYSGIAYAIVRSKLNIVGFTNVDIEDCAADTFINFHLKLDRFQSKRSSIKAFLCICARNKAVDLLRKKRGNLD